MATIRKRKSKNGELSFYFQVKTTDKGSGEQILRTLTWHPEDGMSEKKAEKAAQVAADAFEKEVIASISGCIQQTESITKITFRTMSEKWLDHLKRDLSTEYYYSAKKDIEFVNRHIGGYKLREITPAIIQNFFNLIDDRRKK